MCREVEDLHSRLEHAADILDECLDIDALLALAESAPDIEYELSCVVPEVDADDEVTIAVASDKAFCFYYEESLEVLRRLGANIVEFSPLVDSDLPDGTCAIYLGGGYPELYAQQLSENLGMLQAIRDAYDAHMPIFAECGGFLYLKESMRDQQGRLWPMAGILPGSAEYTGHLKRFGYVELAAQTSGMGFNAGDTVRAHEFHYYDSDFNGQAFLAQKAASKRSWECGVLEERLLAGFPHLYLPACEGFAKGFVRAATDYKAESAR